MEEVSRWFTLSGRKGFGTTVDIYEINLTIPLFNKLLKTHAMTRDFRTKSSIIRVPDTPFRLKLMFIGRKNEVMEIYFISKLKVLLKSQLNLKLGDFSETFLAKDYFKVIANKWGYVCSLKDPGFRADVSNDTLDLNFRFKVSLKPECINSPVPQLSDDFQILLTDGQYSDVTLKSINGHEFKVHKNILSIRSAVLKAHFDHDLKERHTNIVETHFETEVLRDVLTFLYTDTVSFVDRDPGKLLSAAEYYQVQGLKNMCENALYKKLNVENAMETLELADLHNANNLELYTLEFIKCEGAKAITETEAWKKNTSAELVKKIYEYMMNDVSMDILAVAYNQL